MSYISTNPSAGWTPPDSATLARIRSLNTGPSQYGDPFASGDAASQIAPNTATSNLAAAANNVRLADLINATNLAANAKRLGPAGEANTAQLQDNISRGAQGIISDPEYAYMKQRTNELYPSFGVDSPQKFSAVSERYLKTAYDREQDALKSHIALLSTTPQPFNMGDLITSPATYAGAASADAARRQSQSQFEASQAAAQQRADDELAYRYYVANLSAAGRGGSGGGGGQTVSAAEYNSRPAEGAGGGVEPTVNPFTGKVELTGAGSSGGFDNYWNTGGYSDTGAPRFEWDSGLGAYINTADGSVVSPTQGNVGSVYDWTPSDFESTPVASGNSTWDSEPATWEDYGGFGDEGWSWYDE